MLFSNDQIAAFINEHFEPAWQSVRPVPVVRIDFGDGVVVTRTLQGNVATCVCDTRGDVLDVLPGIYEPGKYLEQLEQLSRLARYVSARPIDGKLSTDQEVLRDYHSRQAAALAENQAPEILQKYAQGVSITGREIGVKIVLAPARRLHARGRAAGGRTSRIGPIKANGDRQPTPNQKLLQQDTHVNESVRRRLVHEYLASKSPTTPAAMTRWLYREVLKADLDDPHLGLGRLLFPGD